MHDFVVFVHDLVVFVHDLVVFVHNLVVFVHNFYTSPKSFGQNRLPSLPYMLFHSMHSYAR